MVALRNEMRKHGMSVDEAAKLIDVNPSTLYRKFAENAATMTIAEASKIALALHMSAETAQHVFFSITDTT